MKNTINNFNLWRLKRMMVKALRLSAKINRLGVKIERREKDNINLPNVLGQTPPTTNQ